MTQKELVNWALSGVKQKQIALSDGYQKYKNERPDVAMRLRKTIEDTELVRRELEEMKEALENV